MAKNRALVSHEEDEARKTIRKTLSGAGYDCVEAKWYSAALECIERNPPDLVILEYSMAGGLSGEIAAKIARYAPNTAMVMSGKTDDFYTIIACMRSGVDDYLIKPFTSEDILSCANRALNKKQFEKEINEYQLRMLRADSSHKNEMRRTLFTTLEGFVFSLESNDPYIDGHSRRVTRTAAAIGREMGFTGEELENLRWAALLHDVGKLALNPSFQNKPGPLTRDEYRYIMTHAMVGVGIIQPLANPEITEIVLHHHDHFDGSGLDQKVKKEDIPVGARILALADSFDALTSRRPFRPAFSIEDAIGQVVHYSGTQFDPDIVRVFLKLCRYLFN